MLLPFQKHNTVTFPFPLELNILLEMVLVLLPYKFLVSFNMYRKKISYVFIVTSVPKCFRVIYKAKYSITKYSPLREGEYTFW